MKYSARAALQRQVIPHTDPRFDRIKFAEFYHDAMSYPLGRREHRRIMGFVWLLRSSLISWRGCPRACIEQIEAEWGWPKKPISGLYFLWNGPELIYIGRSKDLRLRLRQHAKQGWPMGRPDSVGMLRYHHVAARLLEARLIERFRPRGNKALHPNVILRRRWSLQFPYRLLSGLPV